MIFAIGAPESFAVPREVAAPTETLDIACSENGQYIATVTSSGVFIWSAGQSRVLLAHVAPPIDEHDVIWRAIWSANSSQLAILTLASLVVVYDVAARGDDVVLDFHFASAAPARPFVNLPPVPRVEIREATSFHVAAGIACATVLADSLLVLSKDDRIVAYSWTGEIRAARELASVQLVRADPSAAAAAAAAVPPPPPMLSTSIKRSASNSSSGSSNRLLRSDSVDGDDESLMNATDAEFASRRPDLRGVGVAVAVAASLALHCVALVFNTGHSVLLCAPAAVDVASLLASLRGVWLDAVDATCVAFNAHHKLLSVGCANAAVHIYNVERQHANARNAVLPRLRSFSLRHWGIEASAVGPVTGLRWSPDESALCVGWQRRGVSVWSIYGCRLMCTVSQTSSGKAEFAMAGVTSVCWTRDGFFLLVATARSHMQSSSSAAAPSSAPQSSNAAEWRAAFHQLSFVKNSLATNPTMSAGGRLLLLGSDRLYYLTWPKHKPTAASAGAGSGRARADSNAIDLGDAVPSEIAWRHLPIPQSYLASSWPIEHAAVSRDGSQLAIAGKRGLALYNTTTTRWKLFGDEREERRVECRGLCWFGRDVVIAVVRPSGDDGGSGGAKDDAPCELRCYPRSHLSERACLHRSPLPGRREPRFIDCNGLFLVLFTRDAFFYQFELVPHCGSDGKVRRIDTRLVHQVSMAGVAADPLLLSLLPPPSRASVHSSQATIDGSTGKSLPNMYGSATCLVLNASGDLSLTNAEDNQQMTLAHAVEQFWLSSDDARRDIGSTLWAHGQAGVQVWFPFAVGHEIHAMKLMSRDQSLEFDLEVYPVGFVPELAVVVGIAQRVEPTPGSSVPSFVLHTKTHPFLHSILRHLLETGDEEHAFDIATRFASVPHFVHSLELLLHETLQDDYSSVPAARSPTRPGTPQRSGRPTSPRAAVARCRRRRRRVIVQRFDAAATRVDSARLAASAARGGVPAPLSAVSRGGDGGGAQDGRQVLARALSLCRRSGAAV
jgi:WD40 repeat protein